MAEREELALRKLVQKADSDPGFLAKLCEDPQAVAGEYGVDLAEAEVAQLKRLGELMMVVSEFTAARIPDPIFYPIDRWWTRAIADHILFYNPIFYPIKYHIFYTLRYPIFYTLKYPIFYPIDRTRVPGLRTRLPGLLRRRVR